MDGIKQLIDNLKQRLGTLSFNQKVLLGAVATASVISMTIFSLWLQKEEKAVLFTNLSAEDASAALAELNKLDVQSELTNGGTTILVPENVVHRLRVDLAAKGVPTSGTPGMELFDGKQYGMTEFLQNVNFKRALEGELTKTIESLQGIQSARVHLVLPKPSIFQKLAAEPTASVVLRVGRNADLGQSQINGIQNLVAGSVENLEAENVSVINQHGKVLSAAIADEEAGRSESQLALRQEVETYLSGKAGSMLDEVMGVGKSIVRVDATLNFEKIDREREVFDPQGTVVRSEERNEKNEPQTGGTDESSITNYEINRTVEHIVGHTGGIKNLSVAVFVDGHYEVTEEGGEPVYTPLSENELGQLKRIVQTAVGLNTVRGDQIEIVNMQFRQSEDIGGPAGMAPDWIGIATQYGGKVVLVIILAVMVLALKKNLGGLVAEAFQPAAAKIEEQAEAPESFDGIPDLSDQVLEDIQEYAAENPERVAEVLQSWIRGIEMDNKGREAVGS